MIANLTAVSEVIQAGRPIQVKKNQASSAPKKSLSADADFPNPSNLFHQKPSYEIRRSDKSKGGSERPSISSISVDGAEASLRRRAPERELFSLKRIDHEQSQ
jgi:hypothetical protein